MAIMIDARWIVREAKSFVSKKFLEVNVLPADHGDCFWVSYGDEKATYRLLIDAGTVATFPRLAPLLRGVASKEPSHELFVITHIDADHIGGALALLEDAQLCTQFKDIWFNGRKHLVPEIDSEAFGAIQGERLTSRLLEAKLSWNLAFNGDAVRLGDDGAPRTREIGGGAILTVLSPGTKQLAKLSKTWDAEVTSAGLNPKKNARLRPVKSGQESFGAGLTVEKFADAVTKADIGPANGSSIAFLMEFGPHRALFSADAHASVLLSSLSKGGNVLPIKVNAFKLPHHGSKGNVTTSLLDAIESDHYIFSSNGDRFSHPDPEAVARVIRASPRDKTLVFNYRTKWNEMWDQSKSKQRWGYRSRYGDGAEGIRIRLE